MNPTNPHYIVGIDLGTTNCVVAYSRIHDEQGGDITLFDIPQVVQPGIVERRALLPSFIFLPGPHDVPPGALALPWDENPGWCVGEFARRRGAEIPSRLIASAKSWLCNSAVDRHEPILPWEGPAEGQKLSPVEAQARLLEHIKQAWNFQMAEGNPDHAFEQQQIFLTVPASFDAVARELTVQAADKAGLPVTLLEEPQAAFYAWLGKTGDGWRELVTVGDVVLVCDIGGGTTDLSLIEVAEEAGHLVLNRIAVGNHILLGGDNMDLTLAHAIRTKMASKGTKLSTWQMRALWHACRSGKEELFQDPEKETYPLSILGQGSSLISGTIRSELLRREMEQVLVEGFFPFCDRGERPQEARTVGMKELGLPYAADARISVQVAGFLQQQGAGPEDSSTSFPSAVLFNGGVTKAAPLRERMLAILRTWLPDKENQDVRELAGADPDQAVARGAVYYGLARQGEGIRIRGGISRSYYIGIESAMPAVPGIPTPMKALCVVPFGMEEGSETDLVGREFGLVVGETARFHFLGSTVRQQDQAGDVIEDWDNEIEEITTLEPFLQAEQEAGTVLPVRLHSKVTEVGTLELWCVTRDNSGQWKLEFNVREQG